jgi:FixJ family two-component response regulator
MELAEPATSSAAGATTRACIGIVDDDASILRALQRLLGAAGFTVQTFASGEELLASQQLDRFQCLVLDVHLTGLSGFDVQERLNEARRFIPIVFITAHDDAATRARARQSGAALYLRKPFEKEALLGAIRRARDAADGIEVTGGDGGAG